MQCPSGKLVELPHLQYDMVGNFSNCTAQMRSLWLISFGAQIEKQPNKLISTVNGDIHIPIHMLVQIMLVWIRIDYFTVSTVTQAALSFQS